MGRADKLTEVLDSRVDARTGLLNDRLFIDRVDQALQLGRRGGWSTALIVISPRAAGGGALDDAAWQAYAGTLTKAGAKQIRTTDALADLGDGTIGLLLTSVQPDMVGTVTQRLLAAAAHADASVTCGGAIASAATADCVQLFEHAWADLDAKFSG